LTSTPERPDGKPSDEPSDRSTWTVPIGHTEYAPLSGSSGYPPPPETPGPPPGPPRSRPPGELAEYPPPPVRPEPEPRSTPTSHRADPDPDVASRPGGVLRHVFGVFIGLLLTPGAIGLLVYGGDRYRQLDPSGGIDHDTRGLVTLGAGAFVLLLVACSGALSPAGPLIGSLWGLVPAGLYLLASDTAIDLIADIPEVPDGAQSGAVSWLAFGCFLAVGATLFGTFVATAIRRRR
jgi:hypothetical protein